MAERYADRAVFRTVYIKEAHPEDEWQMKSNEEQGVCYRQPRTLGDRLAIARDFTARFDYSIPLLVDGMAAGGREAAREHLAHFWRRISEESESRQRAWYSLIPIIRRKRFQWSSKNAFYTAMHRLLVPYDYDRESMDPLRAVISEVIDFPRLHNSKDIKLFVNATDICALKMRIFRKAEVTPDVLCASSCLPFLFQPVKIGQRYYWDGGFMGAP